MRFWLRRARRLLPAAVLVIGIVSGVTLIADPERSAVRLYEAASALLYVNNWATIAAGVSYFDRFSGPEPLGHLWSLSVEEQFYLLWPLLLLAILSITSRRAAERKATPSLLPAAVMTGVLALGSFVLLWAFAAPGFDLTRPYEGTDTRSGGLLIGAAVAMVWRPGQVAERSHWTDRRILDGIGLAAIAAVGAMFAFTDQYSMFIYRGGLLLLSLAAAALVAAAVHPGTWIARILGWAPIRWVGERSYGIYLWHLPVIAFAPRELLADRPVIWAGIMTGLTVMLAQLSWVLLEDPIRRKGFRAYWHDPSGRVSGRRVVVPAARRRRLAAPLAGLLALVVLTSAGLSMSLSFRNALEAAALAPEGPATSTPTPEPAPEPPRTTAETPISTTDPAPQSPSPAATLRTVCDAVVHVGDSTSVGLASSAYLPEESERIPARYHAVGVTDVETDISGARSIVETYEGLPNAQAAVKTRIDAGYEGCWVLAMGNNEAPNQYVGGVVPLPDRIDLMMRPLGDAPVLWISVKTLRKGGPYANSIVSRWNEGLRDACTRYPDMRVYDWAAEVENSWFISDGIHFTTTGWRERAERIAKALAVAFPEDGSKSSGCLVRTD